MGAENSTEEGRHAIRVENVNIIAKYINNSTNIVVLTGAGISTSAGIPDFRSPKTGLYANLERLNLPYAEAVFDISYFRKNPEPFYLLARELYPGKYIPTISHAFIALLSQKGKLRILFTQNIDCLERAAGIPPEQIVEAHGSFATQRCIECRFEYPDDLMKVAIEDAKVPRCLENSHPDKANKECNGLVKPDIVFFGEPLPDAFHENLNAMRATGLALIIGTSLTVHPFASLPHHVREGVPRVLFNMEQVGNIGARDDDYCVLGPCDDGIRMLADALGWTSELEEKWAQLGGGKDVDSTKVPTSLEDEIDQITKGVGEATISKPSVLDTHLEEKQQKHVEETATQIESSTAESDEVVRSEVAKEKPLIEIATSPAPVSPKSTSQPISDLPAASDDVLQVAKEAPQEPSTSTQDVSTQEASIHEASTSDASTPGVFTPETSASEISTHEAFTEEADLSKSPPKSNI